MQIYERDPACPCGCNKAMHVKERTFTSDGHVDKLIFICVRCLDTKVKVRTRYYNTKEVITHVQVSKEQLAIERTTPDIRLLHPHSNRNTRS